MSDLEYKAKYLKYKSKYAELKNQLGGSNPSNLYGRSFNQLNKTVQPAKPLNTPLNYSDLLPRRPFQLTEEQKTVRAVVPTP